MAAPLATTGEGSGRVLLAGGAPQERSDGLASVPCLARRGGWRGARGQCAARGSAWWLLVLVLACCATATVWSEPPLLAHAWLAELRCWLLSRRDGGAHAGERAVEGRARDIAFEA